MVKIIFAQILLNRTHSNVQEITRPKFKAVLNLNRFDAWKPFLIFDPNYYKVNNSHSFSPLSVTSTSKQTQKGDFGPSFSTTRHWLIILRGYPAFTHFPNAEIWQPIWHFWQMNWRGRWLWAVRHLVLPSGLTLIITSLIFERKRATDVQKCVILLFWIILFCFFHFIKKKFLPVNTSDRKIIHPVIWNI